VRRAALVLAALALTGCESNQERSAKLEKVADQHKREHAQREARARRALTIATPSTKISVTATALVENSEGVAALVTLHNRSATTLRDVPIQIDVLDARGASIFKNDTPGTSTTLVSAALVPAHATFTWIDNQIQATGAPASVTAKVGEGTPATGAVPRLSTPGTHLSGAAEAEGSVVNHSGVNQEEVVVYAVARKAGRVVAAARAIVPSAPTGASTPFQLFFIGNPAGARLEVTAPATTLG
jgi:hypothetical protein